MKPRVDRYRKVRRALRKARVNKMKGKVLSQYLSKVRREVAGA